MYRVRAHWWAVNHRFSITNDSGDTEELTWPKYVELMGGEPLDAMRRLRRRYPGYQLESSGGVEDRIVIVDKAYTTLLACDLFWLLNGAEVARDAVHYGTDVSGRLRALMRNYQSILLYISDVTEFEYNPVVADILCRVAGEDPDALESYRLEEERRSALLDELLEALG